jgi:hypothetical protein
VGSDATPAARTAEFFDLGGGLFINPAAISFYHVGPELTPGELDRFGQQGTPGVPTGRTLVALTLAGHSLSLDPDQSDRFLTLAAGHLDVRSPDRPAVAPAAPRVPTQLVPLTRHEIWTELARALSVYQGKGRHSGGCDAFARVAELFDTLGNLKGRLWADVLQAGEASAQAPGLPAK